MRKIACLEKKTEFNNWVNKNITMRASWRHRVNKCFGLRNSLLMREGQNQQQHPAEHNWGVSRERVVAVAVAVGGSDMCQVTGDKQRATCNM